MVTVLRESGFRIIIYTADHEPAHVHVFGDGETKIILIGADGQPEVVHQTRSSLRESRRALEIVTKYRDELLRRWSELHG